MRRGFRVAAAAALALSLLHIPAAAAASGKTVRTDEVCFSVHNGDDSEASAIYGVRYSTAKPGRVAIVLVHGISPAHEYWDLRPDYSVARDLAAKGYTVFAYDRLGWGRSSYDGNGYRLTMTNAQAMTHEVVGSVKAGSYTRAVGGNCRSHRASDRASFAKVVLVGASAGGAITSGYPGRFHDVAAAVPVVWSNQGFSPAGAAYVGATTTWGAATGRSRYRVVPDEAGCKQFLLYPPGVHRGFQDFCANGYGNAAPAGEIPSGLIKLNGENLVNIGRVGPGLPVLLVFGDRDTLFPSDHPEAELRYWKATCGCDVEGWTAKDTAHGLVVHNSKDAFVAKLTEWLAAKGLAR